MLALHSNDDFILMHFDFVNIHNNIWIQKTFLILECDKRPSKLGITYYEQNSNNYWLTMVCALGTAFSPATCDCSMHLKINHVNDNPLGQPVSYRYNYLYLTACQRWCNYNYTICVSRILFINSFFFYLIRILFLLCLQRSMLMRRLRP